MEAVDVRTCFLRNRAAVLLLRRSDAVGSFPGRWAAVSGHGEGDPVETATETIHEETGLGAAVDLVRRGDPIEVASQDQEPPWIVHPYLFECDEREVEPTDETAEYEWVPPPAIRRRETVPKLWEAYRRVAPTAETIRADRDHGAAYLSIRALDVVRDHAAGVDGPREQHWADVATVARDVRAARPTMAVVRNRINRVMSRAVEDRTPDAAVRAATAVIERALDADRRAAHAAATHLDGTVFTLSRSGTVSAALAAADPDRVLVAESRPGHEGVTVAESLAPSVPATLVADAAVGDAMATLGPDAVLVGVDTVRPDGSVVNKVGTRNAALAADRQGIPVVAACARAKVSHAADVDRARRDSSAIYDGEADLAVHAPTFDLTPPDLVRVVTEEGEIGPDSVADIAAEHRELARWDA